MELSTVSGISGDFGRKNAHFFYLCI